MIDREAIEKVLKEHVTKLNDSVMVELHLYNGDMISLERILEFYDGYFVAHAYPAEPLDPNALDEKIPKNQGGQRLFDRMVIPYQSIVYVRVSANRPKQVTFPGFKVE